jgi:hypothetical protein
VAAADSGAQRLRLALEAICAAAEDHLDLLAGLFLAHGEVFHQPGPNALVIDVFAAPFERLLRDGGMDGTLRQVPPTVTATALFNTVGWGYIHLRASHHWQGRHRARRRPRSRPTRRPRPPCTAYGRQLIWTPILDRTPNGAWLDPTFGVIRRGRRLPAATKIDLTGNRCSLLLRAAG